MLSHDPKDVEDAERLAKLWEQLQILESPKVAAVDSDTSELTCYMAQLSANVAAIDGRVKKVEEQRKKKQPHHRPPHKYGRSQRTPHGDAICERCNRPGHTARSCRTFDNVRCYGCSRYGHIRRDCPQNNMYPKQFHRQGN